jgi:hypothetical protein
VLVLAPPGRPAQAVPEIADWLYASSPVVLLRRMSSRRCPADAAAASMVIQAES